MNPPVPTLPFPVIDAHVHLYPDALAPRVTPALSAKFGNAPSSDGTVGGCLAKDAEDGVAVSLNLPVATSPDHVSHTNAHWAAFAKVPPGAKTAVVSLAAMHPLVADKPAELGRVAAAGFAGVKFHPEYQRFRFNDPIMDDCWDAMSALGLVAFLHAGGERVFKPPFHSSPAEIAELHRRFPKLKIAAAHLGGFGMWDEAERELVGQDVWLDLSHTFFWMPHDQILRMIRNHGAHRILFGTDAPWQDPGKVLRALLALPLTDGERRLVCHDVAADLFGISI